MAVVNTQRNKQWQMRPLLYMGLAAIAALTAAQWLPLRWVVALAALCLLAFGISAVRRGAWLPFLTAAVFLLTYAGHCHWQVAPLTAVSGRTDCLKGQVIEEPRVGQRYLVRITDSQWLPSGTVVAWDCPNEATPVLHEILSGEVTLTAVPDTAAYLRGRGVYVYATPTQTGEEAVAVLDDATPPLTQALTPLRRRLYAVLRGALPGEEGAVLAAVCLGEKGGLSASVIDAFRGSGLSHLLVVSGLHLSMVAVALRFALRRLGLGYRVSALACLPLMVWFALMVGLSSSVLRAGMMCGVWLLGLALFRRYDGLSAWGLAVMVLLWDHPDRLLDVGFQLSFSATLGVLCLASKWFRPIAFDPDASAVRRWAQGIGVGVRGSLAVCLSATLFTLPLLCVHYGGFSVTGPIANLLAVVPAGWALLCGWLGMLCCLTPLLSWLGQPLLYAAGAVARYLCGVARLCSPDAVFVSTPLVWQQVLVTAVCVLTIVGLLCRVSRRRLAASLTALTVLTVAVAVPLSRDVCRLTVSPCGNGFAVLVQEGDSAALMLDDGDHLTDAAYLLERQGCTDLDSLFVGEGACANGGTLTSLCRDAGLPTVYTADPSWCRGLPVEVASWQTGQTVPLWDGCCLTLLNEGWWRLDTTGGSALLATNPNCPCPQTAALTIYGGCPRTLPETGYHVVCSYRTPTVVLTEQTLVLMEDITLTTRPGREWSVLPWL